MNRSDYNQIFDNGVKHIEGAKILAHHEMYGFAISHLILGIEELIKYHAVMTKSVNNYPFDDVINPQNKKSIFRNHSTKHELLKEFQEAISDDFSTKFYQVIKARATGENLTENYSAILKNRFKEWGFFFNMAGSQMNIPKEERNSFFDWLAKANDTKNNGFYVDLKDEIIETPERFFEEDFKTSLSYATSILKQTEFMKSVDLTDDEILELQKTL